MTKRISLLSDLHLEYRSPEDYAVLLDQISAGPPVELTILAGDVAPLEWLASKEGEPAAAFLKELCRRRGRAVYVMGNHEVYGCSAPDRPNLIRQALEAVDTFRLNALDRSAFHLGKTRILGCTMYWPPAVDDLERHMRDYTAVRDFKPWVYAEGDLDDAWLHGEVQAGDVVVTHLMPSMQCVSPLYRSSSTNCFFVRPMDDLIAERRPAAWCWGHTHDSNEFVMGETHMLCNPKGYPGERQINPFSPTLTFEV